MLLLFTACQPASLEHLRFPPEGNESVALDSADTASSDSVETIDQGDCAELHPAVRLNEVVTANLESLTAPEGGTPDWLELINHDESPVALEGWVLEADGSAWTLPAQTLMPGGVALILAEGSSSDENPQQ